MQTGERATTQIRHDESHSSCPNSKRTQATALMITVKTMLAEIVGHRFERTS
jgi:hypothetical protein